MFLSDTPFQAQALASPFQPDAASRLSARPRVELLGGPLSPVEFQDEPFRPLKDDVLLGFASLLPLFLFLIVWTQLQSDAALISPYSLLKLSLNLRGLPNILVSFSYRMPNNFSGCGGLSYDGGNASFLFSPPKRLSFWLSSSPALNV